MGHTMGISHDSLDSYGYHRYDSNGIKCYGYMDYTDHTNYWSTCTVEDLTKQDKRCLTPQSGSMVLI